MSWPRGWKSWFAMAGCSISSMRWWKRYRRFLNAHRPELIESQVRADVRWGLHGKE